MATQQHAGRGRRLLGPDPAEHSRWLGRVSAYHAQRAATLRAKADRGYRLSFRLGLVSVACAFVSVGLRVAGWLLA